MSPEDTNQVTLLMQRAGAGDRGAAHQLLPLVYEHLRRIAQQRMSAERPGHTLQATALVHEAYLRLVGPDGESGPTWENRAHFFAAAAEAMRRILVEEARRKKAVRHGGGRERLDLRDSSHVAADAIRGSTNTREDLEALSTALKKLHAEDPQKATLVKLRYFTGMTIPQTAEALGISHATAERWWTYSRLRLFQWMRASAGDS